MYSLLFRNHKRFYKREGLKNSYCQTKTMNTWNILGMIIVLWPIKAKIRTHAQVTTSEITVAACSLVFPRLINSSLATHVQWQSKNISHVYGFVSFAIKLVTNKFTYYAKYCYGCYKVHTLSAYKISMYQSSWLVSLLRLLTQLQEMNLIG